MNCDCIDKVQEKLREHYGDPEAKLDKMWQFQEKIVTIIPVYYSTRTKKKDGTLTARPKKEKLAASYCPFCGTKVDIKTETSN
jgi:hypothetical protein